MTPDSGVLGLSLAAVAGSFIGLFLGGFSKGALGVGLPLIAVPVLAFFMPVPEALVILTVPIFVTNIWQALQGGNLRVVLKRFWPMAVALVIGIGLGTQILVRLSEQTLYLIMGLMVLTQPALRVLKPGFTVSETSQRWAGPVTSLVSGGVGGMSGFFGPLLMVYLATIRLPKDIFTATVAMLFFFGGLALAVFLAQVGVMQQDNLLASAFALLPAAGGIMIGQKIRSRISQKQFEKALTVVMLVMGLSLLAKAI